MHVRWRLRSRWLLIVVLYFLSSFSLTKICYFMDCFYWNFSNIDDHHVLFVMQLWATSRWAFLFRGKNISKPLHYLFFFFFNSWFSWMFPICNSHKEKIKMSSAILMLISTFCSMDLRPLILSYKRLDYSSILVSKILGWNESFYAGQTSSCN